MNELKWSISREDWLKSAVAKIQPYFLKNGYEIHPHMISCGFPATGGLKSRLGECWSSTSTFDGTRHILVSPRLGHEHTRTVLGVIMHELLHCSLSDDAKHGPSFKEGMKKLGLEGKAKEALPGPDLDPYLEELERDLGEFPNIALKPAEKTPKEKANSKKSFKLFCPKKRNAEKSCRLVETMIGGDYTVTASRKSLKFGFPLCPGCASEMNMEDVDFELYKLSDDQQ